MTGTPKHLLNTKLGMTGWNVAKAIVQRHEGRKVIEREPQYSAARREYLARYDSESRKIYATAVEAVQRLVEEAKAGTPKPFLLRPKDAADSTRVSGEAAESLHGTGDTIAARIRQGIAEGDHALVDRLVRLHEPRMQFNKNIQNSRVLSDALVEGKQALDAIPEVVARREHLEWVENVEQEARYLAGIAGSSDPYGTLTAHLVPQRGPGGVTTLALPALLPMDGQQ